MGSDRVKTGEYLCNSRLCVASLQETPGAALLKKLHIDQSPQWQPLPRLRDERQPRASQDAVLGDGLQVGTVEWGAVDVAGGVHDAVAVLLGLEVDQCSWRFSRISGSLLPKIDNMARLRR